MKRMLRFLLCAALFEAVPASAQYLWVNLSFKAVLNPTNGMRAYPFTTSDIDRTIDRMNQTLANYQRGYRVRRVDPLYDIGGANDPSGPSKWFAPSPRDPYPPNPTIRNQEQMDSEARNNPLAYRWNSNAVNYYVIAGFGPPQLDTNNIVVGQPAGEASFPSGGYQIITLGTVHFDLVILHETGHWFELYHTQGSCGCIKATGLPDANCTILINGYSVGDDGIADTLLVQPGDFCFTSSNHIALANFNKTYAVCTDLEKSLVDDTYLNLMAYGFDKVLDRLTPQQLDRWTRYANIERAFAVNGRSRFVSATGNDANTGLAATTPKRTVLNAVNASAAGGSDVVLLRPGNYNETITVSRPVTLRAAPTNSFAAYARWATIGRP